MAQTNPKNRVKQALAMLELIRAITQNRQPSPRDQQAVGMSRSGTLRNLLDRPVVNNPDGSWSTTSSASTGTPDGEMLFPTVYRGAHHDVPSSLAHAQQTGQNLGTFGDWRDADAFAEALHNYQQLHALGSQQRPSQRHQPRTKRRVYR